VLRLLRGWLSRVLVEEKRKVRRWEKERGERGERESNLPLDILEVQEDESESVRASN